MPVVSGEQLDLPKVATIRKRKVATIRKRTKEESAITDGTCTPKWLCDMLPKRDFDPCSNSRAHVNVLRSFCIESGQDGLKMPWHGEGFINWPFSFPDPWADKSVLEMTCGHCTDLIVLCKHDESTEWWATITSFDPDTATAAPIRREPPEKWPFLKRVQYDEHPDMIEKRRLERIAKAIKLGKPTDGITGESSNNFCSVILHHRGWAKRGGKLIRKPKLDLESVARRWLMARQGDE
jgi:hypothetical protein